MKKVFVATMLTLFLVSVSMGQSFYEETVVPKLAELIRTSGMDSVVAEELAKTFVKETENLPNSGKIKQVNTPRIYIGEHTYFYPTYTLGGRTMFVVATTLNWSQKSGYEKDIAEFRVYTKSQDNFQFSDAFFSRLAGDKQDDRKFAWDVGNDWSHDLDPQLKWCLNDRLWHVSMKYVHLYNQYEALFHSAGMFEFKEYRYDIKYSVTEQR